VPGLLIEQKHKEVVERKFNLRRYAAAVRESGRPRGDRTRRRILDVTLDVIAEQGVRAVTQRHVSAAAEASVGLITYYFSSTESLIAAALDQLAAAEAQRLTAAYVRATELGGDLDALADLLVEDVAESAAARRRDVIAGVALTLEIPKGTVARTSFEDWERAQQQFYRAIATAAGAAEPEAAWRFLMASVDGMALYSAISSEPDGTWKGAAKVGFGSLLRSMGAARARSSAR
jgi:TetR/AcrR family transcriptional regulator, regulator of biofilm formation and stress response